MLVPFSSALWRCHGNIEEYLPPPKKNGRSERISWLSRKEHIKRLLLCLQPPSLGEVPRGLMADERGRISLPKEKLLLSQPIQNI